MGKAKELERELYIAFITHPLIAITLEAQHVWGLKAVKSKWVM